MAKARSREEVSMMVAVSGMMAEFWSGFGKEFRARQGSEAVLYRLAVSQSDDDVMTMFTKHMAGKLAEVCQDDKLVLTIDDFCRKYRTSPPLNGVEFVSSCPEPVAGVVIFQAEELIEDIGRPLGELAEKCATRGVSASSLAAITRAYQRSQIPKSWENRKFLIPGTIWKWEGDDCMPYLIEEIFGWSISLAPLRVLTPADYSILKPWSL